MKIHFIEVVIKRLMKNIQDRQNNIAECLNTATPNCNQETYLQASTTLEGALVIPVFIFAVATVMYMLQIVAIKTQVSNSAYKSIKKMAAYSYTYKNVKDITGVLDALGDDSGVMKNIITNGVNEGVFETLLLKELGKDFTRNNYFVGGDYAFVFLGSEIMKDGSRIDVKIKYSLRNPFYVWGLKRITVSDRFVTDAWLGEDFDSFKSSKEGVNDSDMVYITLKGMVYHTNPQCSYLLRNIKNIKLFELSDIRNASGGKYYPCETCKTKIVNSIVFYTEYGSRYHNTANCSQLQRTVLRVPLSEVDERAVCEKCGGD